MHCIMIHYVQKSLVYVLVYTVYYYIFILCYVVLYFYIIYHSILNRLILPCDTEDIAIIGINIRQDKTVIIKYNI